MRFEDERYVRVYTRDTVNWKMMPWQAKALQPLLFRKVDRAGILELGGHGAEGVAAIVELPIEVVAPGLEALIRRGTVVIKGDVLVLPRFLEAQEAVQSDSQRKRDQRERARARARLDALESDTLSADGTAGHETGQSVRLAEIESREVTRGHSDPIRSVPTQEEERDHARTRVEPTQVAEPTPTAGFVKRWGDVTGECMPDAWTIGEVRKKISAYAAYRGGTMEETITLALAAFSAEVASWRVPRPLTSGLFLSKWGEIQARMAGAVPKAARPGDPATRPQPRPGRDVMREEWASADAYSAEKKRVVDEKGSR